MHNACIRISALRKWSQTMVPYDVSHHRRAPCPLLLPLDGRGFRSRRSLGDFSDQYVDQLAKKESECTSLYAMDGLNAVIAVYQDL